MKENDLDRLDAVHNHLSAAPLSRLLLHNSVLDGSVVKYFELAQLSIQFLLFCKQFLDQSVTTLRNNCAELRRRNEKLERLFKRRNEELLGLNGHNNIKKRSDSISRTWVCSPKCCKDAINSSEMEIEKATTTSLKESRYDDIADIEARQQQRGTAATDRAENRSQQRIEERDINLINAIKLELEVKHLRARLAEVELERGRSPAPAPSPSTSPTPTLPPPPPPLVPAEKHCKPFSAEKRDVGVQIDGISIVEQEQQTEKGSVIVDDSPEPTAFAQGKVASAVEEENAKATASSTLEAVAAEERLMALVQEQLSKALEEWQTRRTNTKTSSMNETKSTKELHIRGPELEPDQKPNPSPSSSSAPSAADSAVAEVTLSGKPTEIIPIAAEMSPVPQRNAFTAEDVLKLAIEEHWQSKYNQLEELMAKLEDVQPKRKKEELLGDLHQHGRGTRKIDKNELLTPPQVGSISAESWQPTEPTRHRHLQVATVAKTAVAAERVQTGSRPSQGLSSQTRDQSPSQSSTSSSASSCSSIDNNDEDDDVVDLLALNQPESVAQQCDSDSTDGKASTTVEQGQRRRRKRVKEVRRKVIRSLNDRLRDMGIQEASITPSGISAAALSAATCQLADARELQKGKWKKFFVIRNRVVAKVNGLVTAGLRRDREIIQEVLRRQEVKRPAIAADEEKALRLSGDLKSGDEESWQTDEPGQEGSEMSSAPGSANLVTMFNRIRDGDDTEEEEQESGRRGALETDGVGPFRGVLAAPPKPLPRKVLFNLRENSRKLDSLESFEAERGGKGGEGGAK